MYGKILNGISDGVYFVDSERKINFWNKASENITGYLENEVINKCCSENILVHIDENGRQLCKDGCPLFETIKDGKQRSIKGYLKHKKGHRVPVVIKAIPIYDGDKIIGAVETFTDVSPNNLLLNSNNELLEKMFKDDLTNLPNRRYLNSHLESVMLKFEEIKAVFGVMFFDLDFFKKINDNYGHNAGDEVLKMVANVFKNSSRNKDVIGRWGGEEFLGVFENIEKKKFLEIAERIRMLIENSQVDLGDEKIKVTVSIGVAIAKEGEKIETVIRRADEALYLAKKKGRNRVEIKN